MNQHSPVWGSVRKDGQINSGNGIESVTVEKSGVYTVSFKKDFKDIPAVTCQPVNDNRPTGWYVWPLVTELTRKRFEATFLAENFSSGSTYETDFCFTAIGETKN